RCIQISLIDILFFNSSTKSTNACPTTSSPTLCTFLILQLVALRNDFPLLNVLRPNCILVPFQMCIAFQLVDEIDAFPLLYTTSSTFLVANYFLCSTLLTLVLLGFLLIAFQWLSSLLHRDNSLLFPYKKAPPRCL